MYKIKYLSVLFLLGIQLCYGQKTEERIIPLDSVFVLAERNSTHLKLSQSLIETKEAAIEVAKDSRLPSIDLRLSAVHYGNGKIWDRDFSDGTEAPIPHFGNDFSLQASYVLFAGGAISTAIDKNNLEAQVAALSHEKNRTDIRFLVAGYYLNLYKLYNQKRVFEKNIEQTEEVIRQVKAKLEAGMALDNDLTRYELLRQNLMLSLIETENSISIINQHLQITLGLPKEIVILPDSSVQQLEILLAPENDYLRQALENRRDLQIKTTEQEIAKKNLVLTKADLYPSLTLVGTDILTGPILVEVPPLNKNLHYWFAGLSLKYNIAAIYKNKRNRTLAYDALATANLAYDTGLEETRAAVHSAYTKYSETYTKLEVYEKSFELATQNYSVINNRYKNDLVLITEMLDASNMKLNAELQVVNARLDVVYQYFNLLREIGTL